MTFDLDSILKNGKPTTIENPFRPNTIIRIIFSINTQKEVFYFLKESLESLFPHGHFIYYNRIKEPYYLSCGNNSLEIKDNPELINLGFAGINYLVFSMSTFFYKKSFKKWFPVFSFWHEAAHTSLSQKGVNEIPVSENEREKALVKNEIMSDLVGLYI